MVLEGVVPEDSEGSGARDRACSVLGGPGGSGGGALIEVSRLVVGVLYFASRCLLCYSCQKIKYSANVQKCNFGQK